MNKIAGDIITLHMCTKNLHHMRHSSWETEWDRLEALKHENNILWEVSTRYIKKSHMCEKPEKSEFWKNEQNCWRYYHFTRVPKTSIIWGTVLRYRVRQNCLSFWTIFGPSTPPSPLTTQKTKILKNEKSTWRCHNFELVQQKTWSYDVCLLRYGVWQT